MSEYLRKDNDVFEIVDTVPLGYSIWNIGRNMPDGYLPFCRLCATQPFEGAQCIETDTLKAVKTEGAQTILAAVGRGAGDDLKSMERYLEKHPCPVPGTRVYSNVARIKKALPYLLELRYY